MSTKEAKQMDKALFDFYGKPSIGQALPLAIQHVLAMIVGCVTPSIIVAGVAGLSQEDSVILIQAKTGDVGTDDITAIVSIYKTKNFRIGSALPVMMGISFAYVPSMQAIASDFDIATILGAQIIGGVVALLVGLNIKRIRKFFPPLITGTVVFSIGLSLYPTAINYMAGGASKEDLWIMAELGGCDYYIDHCNSIESLRKRGMETGIHPDRNYCRIYRSVVLWNGRFFICVIGAVLPASETNAFWNQV